MSGPLRVQAIDASVGVAAGGRFLASRTTAFWVSIITVLVFLGFGVISRGGVFFSAASINGMLLDASTGLMLAVGMAFLLSAAQLDLSVGSNMILSSVIAVNVLKALVAPVDAGGPGLPIATAAIIAALASVFAGVLFGVVNGLIVTQMKVNALIATLATGGIALGAVLVATKGVNIAGVPTELQRGFGSLSLGGVLPAPTLLAFIVCGLLWYLMRSTRTGVRIRAVGSSPEAAIRNGISSNRLTIGIFVLMGGIAGLSGFLSIARFGTTNISGNADVALVAIAAAVIGGTSLFGGVVSIGGSMIGSLLPIVLGSGLIVVGVQSFYQRIVVGVILILAVFVDQQQRSRRE